MVTQPDEEHEEFVTEGCDTGTQASLSVQFWRGRQHEDFAHSVRTTVFEQYFNAS
jgi:hypothetical protein